jgi:hemolysin III
MTSHSPESASASPSAGDSATDLPNIPLLDDAIAFDAAESKPTWRGWIHAGTFPLAIVLGVILIFAAEGPTARASTSVFFTCSLLLFGTSALYHRINWSPRVKSIFKRLDHANIFLLIAGSYTPITVLALPPEKSSVLLWLVWSGAGLGILFRIFWIGAPRWLYVPLYLLLSYAAFAFILDFYSTAPAMMTLILVGGLFYTVGAVIYALKRPNPVPGVFGFHEIFHTLTLLAFLSHWTGIFIVATNPPVL